MKQERPKPSFSILGIAAASLLAAFFAGSVGAAALFISTPASLAADFHDPEAALLAFSGAFVPIFLLTGALCMLWVLPLAIANIVDGTAAAASLGLLVAWAVVGFRSPQAILLLGFAPVVALLLYHAVRRHTAPQDRRALAMSAALVGTVGLALSAVYWTFQNPLVRLGLSEPTAPWALVGLALLFVATLALLRGRKGWLIGHAIFGLGVLFFASMLTRAQPAAEVLAGEVDLAVPRVIVLTLDTLRADALSCYNPAAGPTPAIDRLARDGVLFENNYSAAPWTSPSMASLLTGASPFVHGMTLPIEEAELPTLPDYMAEAGYESMGLFGNPILGSNPGFVPSRFRPQTLLVDGFDFWSILDTQGLGPSVGAGIALEFDEQLDRGGNTRGIVELTRRWTEAHADSSFLLWAHFFDPHSPYHPPLDYLPDGVEPPISPGDSRAVQYYLDLRYGVHALDQTERAWVRALYEAEVRFTDAAVGELLDALDEAGLYEDSLIVLTSDHGEEFWEHGRFGHGFSQHWEQLKTPLIIKAPGAARGVRIQSPVSNRALLPTILDLAGVAHRRRPSWLPSLAPLCRPGAADEYNVPLVSTGVELFGNQASVLHNGYRYIVDLESGLEELFDITDDPGETVSVLPQHPDVVGEARQILEAHRAQSRKIRAGMGLSEAKKDRFDPATIERLKSLGYL